MQLWREQKRNLSRGNQGAALLVRGVTPLECGRNRSLQPYGRYRPYRLLNSSGKFHRVYKAAADAAEILQIRLPPVGPLSSTPRSICYRYIIILHQFPHASCIHCFFIVLYCLRTRQVCSIVCFIFFFHFVDTHRWKANLGKLIDRVRRWRRGREHFAYSLLVEAFFLLLSFFFSEAGIND